MRKLFAFLVCIFLFGKISIAQTYTSSCIVTPTIANLYKADVTRLCIARLNETNNPYKDSIEIPQDVYDTIMRAFALMHNMQNSSIKDTIRNLFQYDDYTTISTTNPQPYEYDSTHFNQMYSNNVNSNITSNRSFYYFGLEGDSSINWIKDWHNNTISSTSNSFINSLVLNHHLNVTFLNSLNSKFRFKISIDGIQNIFAMMAAFSVVEPSLNCNYYINGGSVFYTPDGNSLTANLSLNSIFLNYRNACGDCPSGCTFATIWQFRIPFDSCIVNYSNYTKFPDPFTGQTVCLRSILTPIEFGNISAIKQGQQNQINFTALTEVNIKAYEIERSGNAIDFVLINTLAANNKNNSSYIVTDKNPLNGSNYYRIKAIENNGAIKYSKIVMVKNDEIQLNISPNPVSNYFVIESKQMKQINILDMQGKIVFAKTINNTNIEKVNTSQLGKGFYLVQVINNNGEIKTRKIVVE